MAVVVQLPGLTRYEDAHALQEELLTARIVDGIPDVILLLEHPGVITVGRARGAEANVSEEAEFPVYGVERGGDVTLHAPGQLVAYPIVKLVGRRQDLHLHLHSLEEAVIRLLREQHLAPGRDPRNTGVWLSDPDRGEAKKVASIGIACKRWVTWHGLSLNVDLDLAVYDQINPCGLSARVMTRLADHLDPCPTLAALAPRLGEHLLQTLGLSRDDEATHRELRRLVAQIGAELPTRAAEAG